MKHLSKIRNHLKIKLRTHKLLGKCYHEIKDFDKAKDNYMKMLTLAWYQNNNNYELMAYVFIYYIFLIFYY